MCLSVPESCLLFVCLWDLATEQELSSQSGTAVKAVTGGGTGNDFIKGVSVDGNGRSVVVGYTASTTLTVGADSFNLTGSNDRIWVAGDLQPAVSPSASTSSSASKRFTGCSLL